MATKVMNHVLKVTIHPLKVTNRLPKVTIRLLKVTKAEHPPRMGKPPHPEDAAAWINQLFLGSNGLTGPSFCAGSLSLLSFATIFVAISP